MKWTKADVKRLRSQIDGFVLENQLYAPAERICAAIGAKRTEIVKGGLKGFRSLYDERRRKNAEAAEHFEKHPTIYGSSTPEMVERFTKLAERETRRMLR